MNDQNMNRPLIQQVGNEFWSHDALYSKYVPKIPASAEREYVRLTDAYMRILKEELERELPKLKDVYWKDYCFGTFYSDQLEKWIQRNVDLIKTIPEETLDRMQKIVYDGFTQGKTTTRIVKEIQRAQQTEAVITEYIWYTCMDGRVRNRHRELHGKKFHWDALLVVDERTGQRCHPGHKLNQSLRIGLASLQIILKLLEKNIMI